MNMELERGTNTTLISEITAFIMELVPIDVDKVKNRLSQIISKYHVKRVKRDEVHPDLTDNLRTINR